MLLNENIKKILKEFEKIFKLCSYNQEIVNCIYFKCFPLIYNKK